MSAIPLIHVACKQLGLDDDARRDLQLRVVGKASLRDMTDGERRQVLDALKAQGFKPHSKGRHKRAPRRDLRLVHVMWRALGEAGQLDRPGRDGLNAFVRRRFGAHWQSVPRDIDDLRDHDKIDAVIQALRAWIDRAGVPFDPPERHQ